MSAALAVISDGFGQALGASRLIRNASLYVGLLFVLLAGGGVFAEIGLQTWPDGLLAGDPGTGSGPDIAGRAGLILVLGAVMCLAVVIDGSAMGMTLLASRMVGRPVGIRSAIQRARQVFWRLLGATVAVAVLEVIATAVYQYFLGIDPTTTGAFSRFTVETIPGTLVSIPFVLTTAGIVIADDSIGDALRRSARLARRSLPIAVALALFGIAFGLIGAVAVDQGSGLLLQMTTVIHLDVKASGPSFLLAAALGLAITSAFGSILFTVGAVISAAQATAFVRLGMPLAGVMRVAPTLVPERAPDAAADAFAPEAGAPVPNARTTWEAWAERTEPADPGGTRWVSIPMRVIGVFLWVAALIIILGGPPG